MPIKVLIGEAPRLLLQIIDGLLTAEPDVEILASGISEAALPARVAELRPDVVILACSSDEVTRVAHSILSYVMPPTLVALTNGGRDALLIELRTRTLTSRDISPGALVELIRKGRAFDDRSDGDTPADTHMH